MLAYAKQDYDSNRNTTLTGVAKADFSGNQIAARVNAGMPYTLNYDITLTPMVGIEWNHLNQDSYTETGAGVLSLKVNGENINRVRSMLGAILSTIKTMGEYTILPSMHATWRHDFNNDRLDSTSRFSGGGAVFKTPGQKLAQDTFNAGASINVSKSKDFAFSLVLDGEGADNYKAISGQVVGNWKF